MKAVNADPSARWWPQGGECEMRRLLLRHWDVVGVDDLDEGSEAEYADEATRLEDLLRSGATEADVENALSEFAREMSVREDRARDARAAEAIVAWYRNSERAT
jgi:hypothetical protein